MADDTDQTTPDTGTQTAEEPADTATGTVAESTAAEPHGDATDWKAQARKWEKLAKANKDKAEEADGLRDKAARADELQKQLDELTAAKAWERTVGKVSGETGIPVDVLSIVKADSEDKLAEAAKILQAFVQAGQRRSGMGDQSREPVAPQPSGAAAFLAKVNQHAGH